MSMFDHIKQQALQELFCQKGLILLENGKTGFFCFTRVGEPAHISKLSYLFGVEAAWHSVLICRTMCVTEQPKEQPQTSDRGANPVAINQFSIFFSTVSTSSTRTLFSFANILYFTWLTSFDLILL